MPTAGMPGSRHPNLILQQDLPVHQWYRFVLSFPPHLVRDLLQRFGLGEEHRVLDPYCGTGTTLVELKKRGIASVGFESNPVAHFASLVKTSWRVDPQGLLAHAREVSALAEERLRLDGIEDNPLFYAPVPTGELRSLPRERARLLLDRSISPLPLHKVLVLLEAMERLADRRYDAHERLALAHALVTSIGNLRFGPEVGIGRVKEDTPVVSAWLHALRVMADDLSCVAVLEETLAEVVLADARGIDRVLDPASIDGVITSPPYPNEKDYTRTTRLEAVLLGFLGGTGDLQRTKRQLLCSNTRNAYRGEVDEEWVAGHLEVQRLARDIEERRRALGKTSGFERHYAMVARNYFGGLTRHLASLCFALKPGAMLAYVVGDQASYLRVPIRTGQLLADLARGLGYDLVGIEAFRERFATTTGENLREEVVLLRWPAGASGKRVSGAPQVVSQARPDDPNGEGFVRVCGAEDLWVACDAGGAVAGHQSGGSRLSSALQRIAGRLFDRNALAGSHEVPFTREDLLLAARELGIDVPAGLDPNSAYRLRACLPDSVKKRAPEGHAWVVRPEGRVGYRFVAVPRANVFPVDVPEEEVVDQTPEVLRLPGLYDGQASMLLLAQIRYNHLMDRCAGFPCYSLGDHYRAPVPLFGLFQVDEVFAGSDQLDTPCLFPVHVCQPGEVLGTLLADQLAAVCAGFGPEARCCPVIVQASGADRVRLLVCEVHEYGSVVLASTHCFRLLSDTRPGGEARWCARECGSGGM
jgi:SAM-dependent methyltransferase